MSFLWVLVQKESLPNFISEILSMFIAFQFSCVWLFTSVMLCFYSKLSTGTSYIKPFGCIDSQGVVLDEIDDTDRHFLIFENKNYYLCVKKKYFLDLYFKFLRGRQKVCDIYNFKSIIALSGWFLIGNRGLNISYQMLPRIMSIGAHRC